MQRKKCFGGVQIMRHDELFEVRSGKLSNECKSENKKLGDIQKTN